MSRDLSSLSFPRFSSLSLSLDLSASFRRTLLLRPKILEDRPSEPNPVVEVFPRNADELDETTLLVDVLDVDGASPANGKVNWGGDDEDPA